MMVSFAAGAVPCQLCLFVYMFACAHSSFERPGHHNPFKPKFQSDLSDFSSIPYFQDTHMFKISTCRVHHIVWLKQVKYNADFQTSTIPASKTTSQGDSVFVASVVVDSARFLENSIPPYPFRYFNHLSPCTRSEKALSTSIKQGVQEALPWCWMMTRV